MTVSFQSLHSDREIVSRCWRAKRGREIDTSFLPSTGYQNFRSMNSEMLNRTNRMNVRDSKKLEAYFSIEFIFVYHVIIGSFGEGFSSQINWKQLSSA